MYRRLILNAFFNEKHRLTLTSFATPLILGAKDHIELHDPELSQEIEECKDDLVSVNKFSKSKFCIDGTENPHPRFSGLMKSIRERRGEKVEILVPIYNDVNTDLTSS